METRETLLSESFIVSYFQAFHEKNFDDFWNGLVIFSIVLTQSNFFFAHVLNNQEIL